MLIVLVHVLLLCKVCSGQLHISTEVPVTNVDLIGLRQLVF